MSETNAAFGADEPFFHALLMPHRSLGRTGFAVLMGALLFGWAATGAIFLAHGAWPVFGFFGLDVVLLYVAFRVNYRAARVREEVSVSRRGRPSRSAPSSIRTTARASRPRSAARWLRRKGGENSRSGRNRVEKRRLRRDIAFKEILP